MEDMVKEGGNLVDYHSCELFPERWFDAVVVLQTDNAVLYERLTNRSVRIFGWKGLTYSSCIRRMLNCSPDSLQCDFLWVGTRREDVATGVMNYDVASSLSRSKSICNFERTLR